MIITIKALYCLLPFKKIDPDGILNFNRKISVYQSSAVSHPNIVWIG